MSDSLSPRENEGYPSGMPLPDWVADAATKLSDTDNLILLEGMFMDIPALFIARCSVVEEASRVELQVIGMVQTTELNDLCLIGDDPAIYKLSEIAQADSNEAEAG